MILILLPFWAGVLMLGNPPPGEVDTLAYRHLFFRHPVHEVFLRPSFHGAKVTIRQCLGDAYLFLICRPVKFQFKATRSSKR
mmetsp:Transcript_60786/g.113659  ORF Transcript_60786/g.113659 Transcript_60786/m.113659 type:complete len:82 (-) Transcript_60786:339-584(-)